MSENSELSWIESIVFSVCVVLVSAGMLYPILSLYTIGYELTFFTKEMFVIMCLLSVAISIITKYDLDGDFTSSST